MIIHGTTLQCLLIQKRPQIRVIVSAFSPISEESSQSLFVSVALKSSVPYRIEGASEEVMIAAIVDLCDKRNQKESAK